MANYTTNLHLKLPLGSKYWNLDTHNENMKKLDDAYPEIQRSVIEALSAGNVTVSSELLEATNAQDAIDELSERESFLEYLTISEDISLRVPSEGHAYYVLTFGSSVPSVSFAKIPQESGRVLEWLNGSPSFEPNSTYEISILRMSGIWYRREKIDYSRFFEYYIEDNVLYVTKIKASEWYAAFGNYDVIVPSTLLGYPVMLDGYHE